MRGYTTPPYMFLLPANAPRSSTTTLRPERASVIAAQVPAGPAPTTMTSTSSSAIAGSQQVEEFIENLVRVGHHSQVGELHHRTERVGVDADDVIGRAESAGVLHRTTDPERDVQTGIDHDPGRPDLALVTHPSAIGDDTGGSDTGTQVPAQLGELLELVST